MQQLLALWYILINKLTEIKIWMTKKCSWSLNFFFCFFFLFTHKIRRYIGSLLTTSKGGHIRGQILNYLLNLASTDTSRFDLKAAISLVKWRCPLSWLSVGSVASERTEKYLIVTYKCLVTTFSFQSNLDFSNPRDLLQDYMEGTTGDNHVLGPKCMIPDPKRA